MNSAVGPIFNEKLVEKWSLWVPWTVHGTHLGYCSLYSTWTVVVSAKNAWKKKTKKKQKNKTKQKEQNAKQTPSIQTTPKKRKTWRVVGPRRHGKTGQTRLTRPVWPVTQLTSLKMTCFDPWPATWLTRPEPDMTRPFFHVYQCWVDWN